MYFNGLTVVVSVHAVKDTDERNFPISKNRSKRIHKKLIKRYGSEFKTVPCMYRLGTDKLVVHPSIYYQLKEQLNDRGIHERRLQA